MRIDGRKYDGLGAHDTEVGSAKRQRHDVLRLRSAAVVAGQLAAVHDVGIERVGRDVAVLFGGHRMPIAEGDFAVIAAAGNARRTALLLSAAEAIGKGVVGGDMVHLRGGLVVPGTPGFAAVDRDDCALVADDQNDAGIVGIDPDVLVVVASRRAAKTGPRLAPVDGFPGNRATSCKRRPDFWGRAWGRAGRRPPMRLFGTRIGGDACARSRRHHPSGKDRPCPRSPPRQKGASDCCARSLT